MAFEMEFAFRDSRNNCLSGFADCSLSVSLVPAAMVSGEETGTLFPVAVVSAYGNQLGVHSGRNVFIHFAPPRAGKWFCCILCILFGMGIYLVYHDPDRGIVSAVPMDFGKTQLIYSGTQAFFSISEANY